jgi:hypothetical protein
VRIREPVQCPRRAVHHCGGQLGIEPVLGGHLWDVSCHLCGRVAASVSAVDLVNEFGLDWDTLERAYWSDWTPIWHVFIVAMAAEEAA